MVEVIYIPGLNTFNDDRVHIGPLKFFRMHEVLAQHLERHKIKLNPLYPPPMKLLEKSKILAQKITQHTSTQNPVVVVGHSTGGIIARSFLQMPEIKNYIKGIITFGCPHKGSHLADLAQQIVTNHRFRLQLLKVFGYDLARSIPYIADLSSQEVKKFFYNEGEIQIPAYSLICTKPMGALTWTYKLLYKFAGAKIDFPTDGIVSFESQNWGQTQGPFYLDHLSQIGFFKHLVNRHQKQQTLAEFERLVKTIADKVFEIYNH